MSQAGYTPIQLYYSATAAATPSAGNLAAGELAVNITDGKLFYKDNGGVVRVLATAAGSAGDVVGPGSSTDNALVRFDGTTGKLVQNSAGVLSDAGALSGLASVAATTFTGALTGNASTATTLQTSRTIWGQSFDGSANVTGALTGVTDLTASGSLTLNGGVANGVAYLNGSKVLTTGSALTFDGTNLSSTGGATFQGSPTGYSGGEVRLGPTTADVQSSVSTQATGSPILFFDHRGTSNTGLFAWRNGSGGGSELMRLTSTGLGIGTSSPSAKLDVKGGAVFWGVSTSSRDFEITSDASFVQLQSYNSKPLKLNAQGNNVIIESNLGLGVTPSAWWPTRQVLQFNTAASIASFIGSAGVEYRCNAFLNSSAQEIYQTSAAASMYLQLPGQHQWLIAPSGTAGNAISFTQAMTLNSSGQLILNGTSAQTACVLTLQETSGISSALAFKNRNNTQTWNIAVDATAIDDKILAFIDPNAGVVRMGLDSLGNLLVGTTSIFGGLNGLNMQDKNIVQRNSAAASGRFRWQGVDNNNTLIVYDQNNTGVYMVNGGSSWASNSDERLKTTLIPFENAAAKVCAIRAGTGRYLTDEESVSRSFLIAQDVQAVLPEAVNVRDDEIGTLGLQYTDVIPLLTAAIQEQQAIITALTARVAALESN